MSDIESKELLLSAIHAALGGGAEILEVYEQKVVVEYKADNSPLTEADKRAHNKIVEMIAPLGIPILSEEGKHLPFDERSKWNQLWIVDPLDGTKEFVKQNGEFTVNIALIQKNVPQLGVIYVPVEHMLYFAGPGVGAYRIKVKPTERFVSFDTLAQSAVKLPEVQKRAFTMVGSRSHMSTETAEYFEGVRMQHPDAEIISKGSSLKICMIAEGSADVYPRFAPTMEWDTAAGHAIVKEAGFEIIDPKTNAPLKYNKEDLLNPWFIVK